MLEALLLAAAAPACWDVGPAAPARVIRGVLVREGSAGDRRWAVNLPGPVCVTGLADRTRRVTILPQSAAATRQLQAIVRLRVALSGRLEVANRTLVLRVD